MDLSMVLFKFLYDILKFLINVIISSSFLLLNLPIYFHWYLHNWVSGKAFFFCFLIPVVWLVVFSNNGLSNLLFSITIIVCICYSCICNFLWRTDSQSKKVTYALMTDNQSEKATYFVMLFLEMQSSVKSIAQISMLKIDGSFGKCFFLIFLSYTAVHLFVLICL